MFFMFTKMVSKCSFVPAALTMGKDPQSLLGGRHKPVHITWVSWMPDVGSWASYWTRVIVLNKRTQLCRGGSTIRVPDSITSNGRQTGDGHPPCWPVCLGAALWIWYLSLSMSRAGVGKCHVVWRARTARQHRLPAAGLMLETWSTQTAGATLRTETAARLLWHHLCALAHSARWPNERVDSEDPRLTCAKARSGGLVVGGRQLLCVWRAHGHVGVDRVGVGWACNLDWWEDGRLVDIRWIRSEVAAFKSLSAS